MSVEVRLMTEADIDGAIDSIQQAFAEDPYNNWVFPDKSKFSPVRNRQSLTIRCQWGIRHGLFYVALLPDPDGPADSPKKVVGCAMWLPPTPPSEPQTWSAYFGDWWLWLQQVRMNLTFGRGGLNVKRYYIWKAAQAAAQGELWTSPRGYYFCNIVTVLPGWQGKGIGRALMNAVLDRADEEGVECYLESSRREPNVEIYSKLGFKLMREMECDDDGCAITLYCMTRDPKKKAQEDDQKTNK